MSKLMHARRVEEVLQLRERTAEEDKALLMILRHDIEVPYPPRLLVQSMDARELACFVDIFMSIEYQLYAHLTPGQKFSTALPKQEILNQIHMETKRHCHRNGKYQILKQLSHESQVLTVTLKGKKTADKCVNWQVPFGMKMLPLIDYERQRELAKTTRPLVELNYYRFTAVARKGSHTSKDMHWLLTTKLGLEVQAMAHPKTATMGVNDKQWRVIIKAAACPPRLRDITYIHIDGTEILIHHHELAVYGLLRAGASNTILATEEALKTIRSTPVVMMTGQVPSKRGMGTRNYGNTTHPTTLEQLAVMLLSNHGPDTERRAQPQSTTISKLNNRPMLPQSWGQHEPPQIRREKTRHCPTEARTARRWSTGQEPLERDNVEGGNGVRKVTGREGTTSVTIAQTDTWNTYVNTAERSDSKIHTPIHEGDVNQNVKKQRGQQGDNIATWLAILGGKLPTFPRQDKADGLHFMQHYTTSQQEYHRLQRRQLARQITLKKQVSNGMIVNLTDAITLHPADFKLELQASGSPTTA
ncbi:hypothetical protein PHMEG_0003633 [Phytophthora megakarya]|uniref:Uncharacterized protein n=1 Tax=Phytophthora megakarya TaxID=4795 RepID=A0A225WVU2_9STRA|nr:hypothetical protein PHMEG_0003633 [Phytophthora megakarya]